MQKISTHPFFENLLPTISKLSIRLREDDLLKNIFGMSVGLLLTLGFINLSSIYVMLNLGLLLYSVRTIMVLKVEKAENLNDLLNLNYLWIILTGLQYSYNLLWGLFNMFGGYILVVVLNFAYTILLTKLINNLCNWFSEKEKLKSFNMKDYKLENTESTPELLVSQINFAAKLYTINSKLFDEIILRRASNLMGQVFDMTRSGTIFARYLLETLYSKLYDLSKNVNLNNTQQNNEFKSEKLNNDDNTSELKSNELSNDSVDELNYDSMEERELMVSN